jgi:epidermal growth factor receptor substrate 15
MGVTVVTLDTNANTTSVPSGSNQHFSEHFEEHIAFFERHSIDSLPSSRRSSSRSNYETSSTVVEIFWLRHSTKKACSNLHHHRHRRRRCLDRNMDTMTLDPHPWRLHHRVFSNSGIIVQQPQPQQQRQNQKQQLSASSSSLPLHELAFTTDGFHDDTKDNHGVSLLTFHDEEYLNGIEYDNDEDCISLQSAYYSSVAENSSPGSVTSSTRGVTTIHNSMQWTSSSIPIFEDDENLPNSDLLHHDDSLSLSSSNSNFSRRSSSVDASGRRSFTASSSRNSGRHHGCQQDVTHGRASIITGHDDADADADDDDDDDDVDHDDDDDQGAQLDDDMPPLDSIDVLDKFCLDESHTTLMTCGGDTFFVMGSDREVPLLGRRGGTIDDSEGAEKPPALLSSSSTSNTTTTKISAIVSDNAGASKRQSSCTATTAGSSTATADTTTAKDERIVLGKAAGNNMPTRIEIVSDNAATNHVTSSRGTSSTSTRKIPSRSSSTKTSTRAKRNERHSGDEKMRSKSLTNLTCGSSDDDGSEGLSLSLSLSLSTEEQVCVAGTKTSRRRSSSTRSLSGKSSSSCTKGRRGGMRRAKTTGVEHLRRSKKSSSSSTSSTSSKVSLRDGSETAFNWESYSTIQSLLELASSQH